MIKRRMRPFGATLILLAALMMVWGCQAAKQPSEPPSWTPRLVVVLPYQKAESDSGGMARSPLTGASFSSSGGFEGSEGMATLDRSLASSLAKIAPFEIVPDRRSWTVFRQVSKEMAGDSFRRIVAETGKRLKADGVLVGHLYRFRQRQGDAMAASSPASVAFDLAMLRVRDSAVVWKNSFDETQTSLSEDVFKLEQYLKHGIRWYSAQEWASIGMSNLMRRFPWRKTGE